MCTDGVLHCYSNPYLAVLFNPIHAAIKNPRIFEIECSTILDTDGLKSCSKSQTPVKEISLPQLSTNQTVAFAIKCALVVCKEAGFVSWATSWLAGEDRSYASASAAAYAASASAAYAAAAYAASASAAYAEKLFFERVVGWVISNIQ
jgi:hypothetical protein